jgi:YhcH/YjgK/YiaL family protein
MVIDKLENIGRYAAFVKDAVLLEDFFRTHSISTLAKIGGVVTVDDTGYEIVPTWMAPKLAEEREWEDHRRFTDVHITLEGRECLRWIPISLLSIPKTYNEQADVEFYADTVEGMPVHVEAGYFVMFLPEDYHKPIVAGGGCGGVKALLKVPAKSSGTGTALKWISSEAVPKLYLLEQPP